MRRTIARWWKRRGWEARWRNADARPAWLEDGPRQQVRAARESGWIPAGTSVVDLGCGIGHTAAWLASLGHRVTAIDVSAAAIERAHQLHSGVPGLTFERADVGGTLHVNHPYDVVLDLGCLHQLPPSVHESYGDNVRRLTAPGSRLLYLLRIWETGGGETHEAKAAAVQRVLGSDFELDLLEGAEMQASHAREIRPGVELRFVRR